MPTEMAHGLNIMKTCEAFAKNGIEVELIVPMRFSISELGGKNPFDYYKVERVFKVKKIFCLDLTPLNRFLGPVSYLIQAISFSLFASFYLLFRPACRRGKKTDIVYSRDAISLVFIGFLKKNIVFEIHEIHRILFEIILGRVKKIVVISKGLKEDLIKKGINSDKILLAPDAIALSDFDIKENQAECRRKLGLPIDKKLVLYAGHLYKWKGVETLVLSSKFLNDDILIVVVGGIKWYLTNFKNFIRKNHLKNILILGHQDYSQIAYYLKAADCLVLTGTEKSKISREYTSPLKMFQYMASSRPIIASDLPSFREILNQNNAFLVKPDNPEALAEGIKLLLSDSNLAVKISTRAYQDVQKYTWDNRAKETIKFML